MTLTFAQRDRLRSCQPFDIEYLENCWLGSKGPPIGNGLWGISSDRWRHVAL